MTDLAEAQRLADAATAGPWVVEGSEWDYAVHIDAPDTEEYRRGMPLIYDGDNGDPWISGGQFRSRADAEFIAWCREGVPGLLDVHEKVVTQLDAAVSRANRNAQTADVWMLRATGAEAERDRLRADNTALREQLDAEIKGWQTWATTHADDASNQASIGREYLKRAVAAEAAGEDWRLKFCEASDMLGETRQELKQAKCEEHLWNDDGWCDYCEAVLGAVVGGDETG